MLLKFSNQLELLGLMAQFNFCSKNSFIMEFFVSIYPKMNLFSINNVKIVTDKSAISADQLEQLGRYITDTYVVSTLDNWFYINNY